MTISDIFSLRGGLEELPSSKYLTEEQRANFNRNKDLLYENYNVYYSEFIEIEIY